MKRRLIAITAALALLFTTVFSGLSQQAFAAESDDIKFKTVEKEQTFYKDPESGHIGVVEDESSTADVKSAKGLSPNRIESAYGGLAMMQNDYPATRNQNPYGTCWAHAATACAEFDLVKNHGVSKASADLSEWQLAYFMYNTGSEVPGLDGDGQYIPSSAGTDYLDMGGNFLFSMHTLASWKAFTKESNMPYSTVRSNRKATVSGSLNQKHDGAQLRNVRYLNMTKSNQNVAVKEAIKKYGAVYISYFHNSNYYNLNKYSLYYNPKDTGTNHDVVIVGWDDSIPASNFKNTPPGNGAWLVRNSWSTDNSVGSEYTYFYMSYYDKSLSSTAYALDFEKGSNSDNLYQHDGSPTHGYVYADGVANVFTARNTGTSTQVLKSVMIPFTDATNVNYEVRVYTDLTGSKPTSGRLNSRATTTGTTGKYGIYTINLKNPVYLNPGEKFAVAVKSTDGARYFDVETSENISYYEGDEYKSWFNSTASSQYNESFLGSGNNWYDAKGELSSYFGNVCLKAKTTNTSTVKYNITYNLNGGTNNSANPLSYLSTDTGTFTLKKPTRSGYHFLGWYTDSSYTNKVTSINYNNNKNVTLYARWCSNSNPSITTITQKATMTANGSYKVTCSTCGIVRTSATSYKASSVKLSSSKLTYNGEKRSPYPVIKTSNGTQLKNGTDYTYTYNKTSRTSTGRYAVTINFKGKYSGKKTLYFTIVPKAPSTASAKLYGYDDIKVSWGKCTGASGYYVYYKKSSASSYNNYIITTNRYVKFANLSDNVKYNFKIVPYYKSGDTRYKSIKSKIVSAITLKKLNQPSMYTKSDGRVSLTWNDIPGASGYQVYWARSKNGTYNHLCTYSADYSGISFDVGKGVTYWYKTRAYKTVDGKKIFGPFSTAKAYTR